jgi:tRNA-dihydrouridine synthase
MHPLPPQIIPGQAPTALAPMQDITMHSFVHLIAKCGPPDYYFTEYYRVHVSSRLDAAIEKCICENATGRPIIAQLIGEDVASMRRAARDLMRLPVAGIDLNLGCPAPKVYRKNVGGGLLRDLERVDELLGALRDETLDTTIFSVKMRYGFEDDRNFERLMELLNKHCVDLVSLHARTVSQLYHGKPDYSYVTRAVRALKCPVLANGDITSCAKAARVLAETGAHGVMIGRAAIRNPWIFRQCREYFAGQPVYTPTLAEVRRHVDDLWVVTDEAGLPDKLHIPRMKKLLNFIGIGVDPEGGFLREMRLSMSREELFNVCDRFMIENGRDHQFFSLEAHPNLLARPNHES